MRKILLVLFILLSVMLTACQKSPVSNNDPILVEMPANDNNVLPDAAADTTAPEDEPPLVPPEIPLYNEYMVSLEIEPETRVINGIERIRFTNSTERPLSEIVMRVYLNAFSEEETRTPYFTNYESRIFRSGRDYGSMDIRHVSIDNDELDYELSGTVLRIHLDEPLAVEQTIQVKIQFEAYIPKIAHRIGANDRALWCGLFLPVLSVYDKDGWHTEPYYPAGDPFYLETANYTVEITTPDGYEVAASGTKREDLLEDKKVTTLTANMSRDFAFAVSPEYQIAERTTPSGVDIHLYYYTESLRTDQILDVAERAMEYFGTLGPYPYGQICIVETDMFVNGMEFSKVVFLDSSYLQRTNDYTDLIHELGHQWFYNVVGNNQIAEAWLDEGMTSLWQECFLNDTEEALRNKMESDYKTLKRNHNAIKNASKRKLASPLSVYDNWPDYYRIQYIKSKLMLYALRQTMGVETFEAFITEYYRIFSFRVASAEDLIALAEEFYGKDLSAFFDDWLYSDTLPDFPS